MPWSAESIEQAIQTAKTKDAIFVVYVEDDTHLTALHGILGGSNVMNLLRSERFVAVRITSSSQSYRDFVDIYQLVPVPSIFFIGSNGWPLEIIGGELSEDQILQRIRTLMGPTSNSVSSNEELASNEAESAVNGENDETLSSVSKEDEEFTKLSVLPKKEEKVSEISSAVQPNNEPLQNEAAETNLHPVYESPMVPETTETILHSTKEDSSSSGHPPTEIATNVASQESVHSLSTVAEDPALLSHDEALLAPPQISSTEVKQDAVTQEPRDEQEQPTVILSQSHPRRGSASEEIEYDDVRFTRIQFRMPDGSSHTHTFGTGTTIREIRQYVIANLRLPYRDFAMSTGYPRFELTDPEESLRQHNMMPTAVILINPLVAVSTGPTYFSMARNALWFILMQPFSTVNVVFTYVYQRLFGGGNRGPRDNTVPEQTTGRHSPEVRNPIQGNQSGARRRRVIQREGNVYRLSNRPDDSDDENNTWNGNSTQQM